jgi:hypothetical protein
MAIALDKGERFHPLSILKLGLISDNVSTALQWPTGILLLGRGLKRSVFNWPELGAQRFEGRSRLFERRILTPKLRAFVVNLFVPLSRNIVADGANGSSNVSRKTTPLSLQTASKTQKRNEDDERILETVTNVLAPGKSGFHSSAFMLHVKPRSRVSAPWEKKD